MKWFKLFGQDLMNDANLMSLTDAQLGKWFKLLTIASIQRDSGRVLKKTLSKVYKFHTNYIKSLGELAEEIPNSLKEHPDGFEFLNWRKYQSDYNLYQKGKDKPSKELKSDLVKHEDIEADKEVEVEVEGQTNKEAAIPKINSDPEEPQDPQQMIFTAMLNKAPNIKILGKASEAFQIIADYYPKLGKARMIEEINSATRKGINSGGYFKPAFDERIEKDKPHDPKTKLTRQEQDDLNWRIQHGD